MCFLVFVLNALGCAGMLRFDEVVIVDVILTFFYDIVFLLVPNIPIMIPKCKYCTHKCTLVWQSVYLSFNNLTCFFLLWIIFLLVHTPCVSFLCKSWLLFTAERLSLIFYFQCSQVLILILILLTNDSCFCLYVTTHAHQFVR